MLRPYCNEESGNPQLTISLVRKITLKQIFEGLFQCFLKRIGTTLGQFVLT